MLLLNKLYRQHSTFMQLFRLFIAILFLHSAVVSAQNEDFLRLSKSEDSIAVMFKKSIAAPYDEEKKALNDTASVMLKRLLSIDKSFDYPLDSLPKIGKIYAPDHTFRIITWNMPLTDGTYQYRGFVQVLNGKTKGVKVFELTDKAAEVLKPENSVLSAGKWYGMLYYRILKNTAANRTYYTMLGLRYCSLYLTQKVIEVLYFDEWGNPVFGAPIFQVENKIKHRIMFNYSARVGISLKYSDELKMIVCDHLAPSETKYTGQYENYGPDFSFDGYQFVKDKWMLKTDLNIKNPNASRPALRNHPSDSLRQTTPVRR